MIHGRHLFGSPFCNHATAVVPPFGPQVDNPVCRLDDIEIVLDDDDRVTGIHQPVQDLQQFLHVGDMQADRWLVQDVESAAGGAPRQFLRQLDALRLAAAQRRRRLPEMDVTQADIPQSLELALDTRNILKEL